MVIDGRPSETAERVAIRRAIHQLVDHPKIFDDPLALRIVGEGRVRTFRTDPPTGRRAVLDAMLRAFLAVRSRLAEDEVAAAVRRGVDRYVVLGAGLDTFAYRNPFPELRVVEIDHPATQTWKRSRLAEAGIAEPPNVTFVPIDFASDSLMAVLNDSFAKSGGSSIFSWLGVAPYLERPVAIETLRSIALTAGPGGEVVFDYVVPPHALDPARRALLDWVIERLEQL